MYFYDDAPWSKIYRTDFLKKNKLFFENIFGEDTSVTFDLYSKTKKIFKIFTAFLRPWLLHTIRST